MAPELDGGTIPVHFLEEFYIALSERGWNIDKGKAFDVVVKVARENSYHPVAQYLNHIADDDGIEPVDLDTLASRYLGTSDCLYDEMLTTTLVGAVARALEPGTKFDTCCVLRGPQGIGKSTFWRTLASPLWFCDTPQDQDKDLKLAIHTCWIYELAELDALTCKKEAAQVKAMLSSPVDQFRPPYGRGTEKHPRRSILVGTCNRDDFLRDETGSRRFWVIEANHRPDTEALRHDRDRIWKAALLAYCRGKLPILSPASQAESDRRNQGYAPEHPWLGLLERWARQAPAEFTTDQVLIGACCVGEKQIQRKHQTDVAPLLRALGFERDKHQTRADGGERARLWRSVAQPVSTSAVGDETGQTPVQDNDLAPLSQPLNLKKENAVDREVGAEMQKDFSKWVETLRQPSPRKPWEAEAMRLHREDPGKAAFTVALELVRLGFPNIQGRQVAELWRREAV
ncbi:MAG: virulence-associated E family protein [Cyanobacteriota bacterium]|nr:virulence-associated E family protein [Cyanobacteriota bacterium]